MATLADSGAVKLKAGENVDSSITAAQYDQLIEQAEALLCATTQTDLISGYSGYNSSIKTILNDNVSSKAALHAIAFNMGENYYSKEEAQTLLNLNWSIYKDTLKLIESRDVLNKIKNGF